MDLWELAGIGMAAGQFFYLKYLEMYGVHSLIAHLDGMTPPKQPKCISSKNRGSLSVARIDRSIDCCANGSDNELSDNK